MIPTSEYKASVMETVGSQEFKNLKNKIEDQITTFPDIIDRNII